MKIAATYENGQVFQHFGHSESFKIYEIEDNMIKASAVIGAGGSGHGALAGFLKEKGVETLICGNIGGGARNALAQADIKLFPGVTGSADEAVNAFLNGTLSYDPNAQCNHHDHDHGHDCGEHHCGEDKHGCAGNSFKLTENIIK